MQVVVCSEVQWRYVRTRKQQILRRFPPDWPILFLQAYVRGRRNDWRPQHDGRVTYVTVPAFKSVPNPSCGGCSTAAWCARWAMRCWQAGCGWCGAPPDSEAATSGSTSPTSTSDAFWAACGGGSRSTTATTTTWPSRARLPGRGATWQRIVRGVDAVVLSSALLREEIEPLRPRRIVEIGNGVDFELFDAAGRAPRQARPRSAALPAPRIGYAGALAEWIDLELWRPTARSFPEAEPGAGGAGGRDRESTRRPSSPELPNVHWLGAKPHDELPHYVAAMDVCLIPFRTTPLTRGVNPNKLWEYLALGKPVVATDFSPFIHDYRAVVQGRGHAARLRRRGARRARRAGWRSRVSPGCRRCGATWPARAAGSAPRRRWCRLFEERWLGTDPPARRYTSARAPGRPRL